WFVFSLTCMDFFVYRYAYHFFLGKVKDDTSVEQGLNKWLSLKRDGVCTSPMMLSQNPCNHTFCQAISTNARPAFTTTNISPASIHKISYFRMQATKWRGHYLRG